MTARVRVRVDELDRVATAQGLRTRYALAKRLGVNPSTVSRVLDGYQAPGEQFIAATIHELGVAFDAVFEVAELDGVSWLVRVRDGRLLRERVEAVGSPADVAVRAGLSPARLRQLLSGTAPVISVSQAARLEDVLGVRRGTFFVYADDDAELVADYLAATVGVEVPEPAEEQVMPAEVPVDGGEV